MNEQRDSTRVKHPRVRLMMIALAMACGRGDAPAAAGPPSVTQHQHSPTGAMGDAVRRRRARCSPATRDSLPSHVGSSLQCFSCHLDEGRARVRSAHRLLRSLSQFRARGARVDLIEDRVNDCFRSQPGTDARLH